MQSMKGGVCHWSWIEAGRKTRYVKVGAIQPGHNAGLFFGHLLNVCEELAREQGMPRLAKGVKYRTS